jgi:ribosomal protein S18 acetylase RimI-like enzyme
MSNTIIRKATLGDSAALQECMESAYSAYQHRMNGGSLPPLETDYASEIAEYPTWVAELEGSVVGGLIMTFEEGVASVSNIAVRPQSQGLGLGRSLLEFAQNQAKHRDCTVMRLATHVLLTENVSLYKHLGWKITGEDDVRVYMEREI